MSPINEFRFLLEDLIDAQGELEVVGGGSSLVADACDIDVRYQGKLFHIEITDITEEEEETAA